MQGHSLRSAIKEAKPDLKVLNLALLFEVDFFSSNQIDNQKTEREIGKRKNLPGNPTVGFIIMRHYRIISFMIQFSL